MVTEDYVSYEVAKLLKDKGFDGDGGDCECHMFYCDYTEERIMPICEIGLIPDNEEVFFAPTHQMAMKWLREEKYVLIFIVPAKDENGNLTYCADVWTWNDDEGIYEPTWADANNIYEKAVEAALKYVLENLI